MAKNMPVCSSQMASTKEVGRHVRFVALLRPSERAAAEMYAISNESSTLPKLSKGRKPLKSAVESCFVWWRIWRVWSQLMLGWNAFILSLLPCLVVEKSVIRCHSRHNRISLVMHMRFMCKLLERVGKKSRNCFLKGSPFSLIDEEEGTPLHIRVCTLQATNKSCSH